MLLLSILCTVLAITLLVCVYNKDTNTIHEIITSIKSYTKGVYSKEHLKCTGDSLKDLWNALKEAWAHVTAPLVVILLPVVTIGFMLIVFPFYKRDK